MRFRASAAASWLVLPALCAGCFVYGESLLEPTGAGGGGGGGATTTSTTGGGGQACTTPEDCPDPGSPCKERACVSGLCAPTSLPPNTEIADPVPGDCRGVICDTAGGAIEVETSSDVPDDGDKCTLDLCVLSEPVHEADTGSACGPSGTDVCNAEGACVECIADGDCASDVCKDYACADISCSDSMKNGSETDVDCGGACQDCATGEGCNVHTDCKSGVCTAKICQASCTDGEKNGSETDVDCGGACGKCSDGETCAGDADCESAICASSICSAPTCSDGEKNGMETAVDCGGPVCSSCPLDHLVINEVDYDQLNTDSLELVEIYNAPSGTVSLAGKKLIPIEGTSGQPYNPIDLSPAGSLAPGQYLVVGSSMVVAAPGALKIDFPSLSNQLQNGSPDGVALIDDNADTLIDALSYEGAITTANLSAWGLGTVSLVEGVALAAGVKDEGSGSLCRLPNSKDTDSSAADWALSTTPTPGAANVP